MSLKLSLAAAMLSATLVNAGPVEPSNKAVVEALFDAFNAHDVDALKTFYAEDAVVIAPESCQPTVGREAIGASYAEMFAQIPDVHDALERVVTEDDTTAVMFTASSKLPGGEFEVPIAAFLTIKDGLVVEDRVFFNSDIVLDCDET